MIIVLVVAMLLLGANSSHAVLQANGGTKAKYSFAEFILKIRQMESLGGTLWVTETINTTTLLPTSESNNLDIHMEKNTEYGAAVILSASSYGKPSKIADGETTTGNETGIVINFRNPSNNRNSYEWTASTFWQKGVIGSKKSKYRDYYMKGTAKIGDATFETNGWHGGNTNNLNERRKRVSCI